MIEMVKEIEKSECPAVMTGIGPLIPIWNEKADHQSEDWHDWGKPLIKPIMKEYEWKYPLRKQADFQLVCGRKYP